MVSVRRGDDTGGGRLLSGRWLVALGIGAATLAGTVVGAGSEARANYPDPPNLVLPFSAEAVPTDCPTSVPSGTVFGPAGLTAQQICETAVRNAPTGQASGAIMYMFSKLGSGYDQGNRYSVNPPIFDCTSFVSRAYSAAGAKIIRNGVTYEWRNVFGYTGAYMPSAYESSNLERINAAPGDYSALRPGDIIIQFDGADPSRSAGNAGHAQTFLGVQNGVPLVIQSTSPKANVVRHDNYFSNEWYFRWKPQPTPSPVQQLVTQLGGSGGWLGPQLENEVVTSSWRRQRFTNGVVYWTPSTGAHVVVGAAAGTDSIRARYDFFGGPASALGFPTSSLTGSRKLGAEMTYFANGAIYKYEVNGAAVVREVSGPIWGQYWKLGAESSYLGLPTSGTESVAGGQRQQFEGGVLYRTASGVHSISGDWETQYRALGGENSALGLPNSSPVAARAGGAQMMYFTNGALYRTGAGWFAVTGDWWARYWSLGGETSALGLPNSAPVATRAGGAQMMYFTNGALYRTGTGIHPIAGEWWGRYWSMGAETSVLGLPNSAQIVTEIPGASMAYFTNGAMYRTSAGWFPLTGEWWGRYWEVGAHWSQLGVPNSDPMPSRKTGTQIAYFTNGAMYRYVSSGAVSLVDVSGAIWGSYWQRGAETSTLGLPVTGTKNWPGGQGSDFERGSLYSTPRGTHLIDGEWLARYRQLGGPSSPLGLPNSAVVNARAGGAQMMYFTNGAIYAHSATGSRGLHGLWGTTWARYWGLGAETSELGLPTTTTTSKDGTDTTGFQRGAIYRTASGTHPISGAWWTEFQRLGAERSVLGLPNSAAVPTRAGGGQMMYFGNGALYRTGTGTFYPVSGEWWGRYWTLGAETSALGLPNSAVVPTRAGGGQMMYFGNGALYRTGAAAFHPVTGDWWGRYWTLGAETSALGLPQGAPATVASGLSQPFAGGALYRQAGASPVLALWSGFHDTYEEAGGPTSALGWITGEQKASPEGETVQFQRGTIVLDPTSGDYVVKDKP